MQSESTHGIVGSLACHPAVLPGRWQARQVLQCARLAMARDGQAYHRHIARTQSGVQHMAQAGMPTWGHSSGTRGMRRLPRMGLSPVMICRPNGSTETGCGSTSTKQSAHKPQCWAAQGSQQRHGRRRSSGGSNGNVWKPPSMRQPGTDAWWPPSMIHPTASPHAVALRS